MTGRGTPGPWWAFWSESNKRARLGGWHFASKAGPLPLIRCADTNLEAAANARLIAAAPAMRDALGAIARGLTNGQRERGETFQSIARAALAAADPDPENPGGCFCLTCGLPLPEDGPCATGCEVIQDTSGRGPAKG